MRTDDSVSSLNENSIINDKIDLPSLFSIFLDNFNLLISAFLVGIVLSSIIIEERTIPTKKAEIKRLKLSKKIENRLGKSILSLIILFSFKELTESSVLIFFIKR